MAIDNLIAHSDDAPILSVLITPHRSLGRTGFTVVMALFGGVSFIAGTMFWLAGAWPVFGFFGLDVALLYFAFRLNYRAAAAYEEISIGATELKVRQVSHHGRQREWTFNPLWVRLETIETPGYGVEDLLLVSRGVSLPIARHLGNAEKESFANALSAALAAARRGPTRTAPG